MVSLTVFKSIKDNNASRTQTFESFKDFESLLYKLSKEKAYKPKKDENTVGSPLISPAVYGDIKKRRNVNVTEWAGWAALDVDSYEGKFDDIINSFGDYGFICYSTASSTQEHPKFRIIVELQTHVKAEDIPHFWYALNKEFLGLGDAQTKDLSRMYYVPGQYPGAYNFIFTREGPSVSPVELMKKYPYVRKSKNLLETLSPEVRAKILEQKRSNLTNRNYSWTSYLDCPFVNSNQVAKYQAITGSGWYHALYNIMVSIAFNALDKGYPITETEIAQLARQIDADNGGWYSSRPIEQEALRALTYAISNK